MDSITLNQPIRVGRIVFGNQHDTKRSTYGAWFGEPANRRVRDQVAARIAGGDRLVRYDIDGKLWELEILDHAPMTQDQAAAAFANMAPELRIRVLRGFHQRMTESSFPAAADGSTVSRCFAEAVASV